VERAIKTPGYLLRQHTNTRSPAIFAHHCAAPANLVMLGFAREIELQKSRD
jgi:hypothetical protein